MSLFGPKPEDKRRQSLCIVHISRTENYVSEDVDENVPDDLNNDFIAIEPGGQSKRAEVAYT